MTVNSGSTAKPQFGADFDPAVTAASALRPTAEALTCCVSLDHVVDTVGVSIHANCVLDRYSSVDIRSAHTLAVAPGGRRRVKEAA